MAALAKLRCILVVVMVLVFVAIVCRCISKLTDEKVLRIVSTDVDTSPPPSVRICVADAPSHNWTFVELVERYSNLEDKLFIQFVLIQMNLVNNSGVENVDPHIRKWYVPISQQGIKQLYACFLIFFSEKPMVYGQEMRIHMNPEHLKNMFFQVALTDADNNFFTTLEMLGSTVMTLDDMGTWTRQIIYKKKIIDTKNLARQPCNENNQAGLAECIHDFLEQRLPCKPPWLGSTGSREMCQTEDDYERLASTDTDIPALPFAEIRNLTGCRRNCKHGQYKIIHTDSVKNLHDNVTHLIFLCDNTIVVTETEELIYRYMDLVADVGGFFGLLLGASILSTYDKFRSGITLLAERFRDKSKTRQKELLQAQFGEPGTCQTSE